MCVNRLDLRKIYSPCQQNGKTSKQTRTDLTELQSTPVTKTKHKHKLISLKPSPTALRFSLLGHFGGRVITNNYVL